MSSCQSLCSNIHLQVYKLGGSTQKIIRKFSQVVVVEPPGEAETKQQCETVYCTHSQRPDWYERSVHYTCTYNTQGAWACRTSPVKETKSLIVITSLIPYGIITFYIPASIMDYYHMLHTGEGAVDWTCSWSLDWKEPVSHVMHQLQCKAKHYLLES